MGFKNSYSFSYKFFVGFVDVLLSDKLQSILWHFAGVFKLLAKWEQKRTYDVFQISYFQDATEVPLPVAVIFAILLQFCAVVYGVCCQ